MTGPAAVVLGCGVAGLCAAAALEPHCRSVVLVERDDLTAATRPGLPQAAQLHNLLGCAQRHLDLLFPGFCDELVDAGAARADVSTGTHVYEYAARMPERPLGMSLMSAPRAMVDTLLWTRLISGSGHTELLSGTRVCGLRLEHGAVAGVRVERGGQERDVPADLVVDSSGSSSPVPRWLAEAGVMPPPVQQSSGTHWYVTSTWRRPRSRRGADEFWLTFATPPGTRGALVSPLGEDAWSVSVSGVRSDPVPRTGEEVASYVGGLEDTGIAELLDGAELLTPPRLFRKARATRHRYDRTVSHPPGLLPIGDSLGSLDPLHGQGISVASWQAWLLRKAVASSPNDVPTLTTRYVDGATGACEQAWALPGAVDELVGAGDPQRRRAFVELLRRDAVLHRTYVQVWHLLEPVGTLREAAGRVGLLQ